jgi:Putative phage tail protein
MLQAKTMPLICFSKNPLKSENDYNEVETGTNLKGWMRDNGYLDLMKELPLLVILNGNELMEADYSIDLAEGDRVAIAQQMEGLDPLTIFYIVVFVASAALYLTTPLPENPNVDTQAGSPTYSLSSRGNKARLEQPKPVIYGTMVTYPDLSSSPVSDYDASGDQFVSQLFELSMGELDVDISTARFEDTLLSSFADFEYEIVPPGQKSNLFPSVIVESSEVSALELGDSGLGPYVANDVGTEATTIAVDVVAPAGIYSTNDEGGLSNYSVEYSVDVREIDGAGAPVGVWVTVGNHKMSQASRDPVRITHTYQVTAARYEVRMNRLTAKDDSIRVVDTVNWDALKAYIGDTGVTNSTRLAVRIRASEQLGNRSLSLFNIKSTRKLEIWNPTTGWSAEQTTNNPCWAFADACRADYGGKRSDAFIDLQKLFDRAPSFDSAGIEFNGVFDSDTNLWDALTAIMMPAMGVPVDDSGIYTFSIDEAKSVPTQMFTMRNIVRDSFSIENVGVLEDTSDSIRAFFYDEDQGYRKTSFIESLPGGTTIRPREVQLFGVTNKDEAHRLTLYMLAQNFYRRQNVKFSTGIEGRIPTYGDLISISHYMINVESGKDSVSGDIVDFDGVQTVTISEGVSGLISPHIFIRNDMGEPEGPFTFNIIDDDVIAIDDPLFSPALITFKKGYERPQFSAGSGITFTALVKITSIDPQEDNIVDIEGFVDAPEVYDIADGVPVPPVDQLPSIPSLLPTVTNLVSSISGDTNDPAVILTWSGARSDYYVVEVSEDQINYFPVGSGRVLQPSIEYKPGSAGTYYFRVAGASILRGDWSFLTVNTDQTQFPIPADVTALQLREAFTGPTLKIDWQSETTDNIVEFWSSGVRRYFEGVRAQQYDLPASIATDNGLGRSFEVRVYAVSLEGRKSTGYASIVVSNPAPVALANLVVDTVTGSALISFDYPTDTDFSGVSVWVSSTSGFTPSDSTLAVDQSKDPVISATFQGTQYLIVAAVDVWGDDSLNYSGEQTIEGGLITETDIKDDSISTPKLKTNSVTADKIQVNNLAAINADLGTATAGTFKTTATTDERFEASSVGDFPLWVGKGAKNAANASVYYDKTTDTFVIRDPVSGFYFQFEAGADEPFKMLTAGGDQGIIYNKLTDTLSATGAIEAASLKTGVAMVNTANIVDASVDTLQIKGQAVTFPIGAYFPGIKTGSGIKLQVTYPDPTGAPISIVASAVTGTVSYFEIRANGVTIFDSGGTVGSSVSPVASSAVVMHTPAAGVSTTYTLNIAGNSLGHGMVATELKDNL